MPETRIYLVGCLKLGYIRIILWLKFASAKRALTGLTKVTLGQVGQPTDSAGNEPGIFPPQVASGYFNMFA